jgi:hypothetical protein
MVKKMGAGLCLAALLAMPVASQAEAAVSLPDNIFQWVQSTSRQSYYFNKEQMCYDVDASGHIDLNHLIVPTVRIYDDVKIEDVRSKRRWNGLSLSGYSDLVGAAEYLYVDLANKTVTITQHDDLDSGFGVINTVSKNESIIKLEELSDKDVEGKFYDAILKYADAHQEEIVAHTKGTLTHEDELKLEAKKHPELGLTPAEREAVHRDKKAAIEKATREVERKQAHAAHLREKANAAVAAAEKAEAEANEAADKLALMQIAE